MKPATRVSRLAGIAGAACLLAVPLGLIAVSAAQPDGDKKSDNADQAKPAAPAVNDDAVADRPGKFDHVLHSGGGNMPRAVVDSDKCTECHASDDRGNLTLPGTAGKQQKLDMPACDKQRAKLTRPGQVSHKPCLDSGCHVRDFLATGDKIKKSAPKRYQKAARFCAGCHTGPPPATHAQPAADNVYCDNDSPDYHLQLNHLRHTEKTACRNCHVVGADNKLQIGKPDHAECATCHTGKDAATPMSYCRMCHQPPGPSEFFKPREYDAVVRACGSPEHLRRARRRGKDPSQISCFKHETKEHRVKSDAPLQCSQCHYMVANRKFWSSKNRYETLREIKSARLIDNRRDRAHSKACGGDRACHARDVDDSSGGSEKCTLCHDM